VRSTALRPTLSIVIPARNEEGSIEATIVDLAETLSREQIPYEVVVVDDHSSDGTRAVVARLADRYKSLRCISNRRRNGFGNAIHSGLEAFTGDAVCIVMADASDDPKDVVTFYHKMNEGYDCVFGTRFARTSKVIDYPPLKLAINRAANMFIALLFGIAYTDSTNAFKLFRREVIAGVSPILSHHFNITVELPLKAIVRGYTYAVVPNNWYNRKDGVSKFKVKEMGSRYLFIVLYVFIEKLFSRGDYRTTVAQDKSSASDAASTVRM
jgi:dolichol-phosphate mannosyltransferase